jgi:RND family efflux transporter MFP subunit
VNVELGDAVKKGQVLARIEQAAQADAYASSSTGVSVAEQDAALAQKQADRAQKLLEAGAMTVTEHELAQNAAVSAQARLADAKARLAASRQQLDGATVRAPFDGVVSQRSVNHGDVVAPGSPLFSVIDPSSMRLTASVPGEEVGNLAVGKEVNFEVRGYGAQKFTGTLERIAPAADPTTRQVTVLVSIPNPGGRLIAGLFAEGRVATEKREGLIVPFSAVDTAGTKPRVLRVDNDQVAVVEVTPGLRDERGERLEITSGLAAGDLVLIGPARLLTAGTKVAVASAATSTGNR